jgi:hypothetical protein
MICRLYGLGASLGGPVGGWINDTFGWFATYIFLSSIGAYPKQARCFPDAGQCPDPSHMKESISHEQGAHLCTQHYPSRR